jgi:hypothetical protein
MPWPRPRTYRAKLRREQQQRAASATDCASEDYRPWTARLRKSFVDPWQPSQRGRILLRCRHRKKSDHSGARDLRMRAEPIRQRRSSQPGKWTQAGSARMTRQIGVLVTAGGWSSVSHEVTAPGVDAAVDSTTIGLRSIPRALRIARYAAGPVVAREGPSFSAGQEQRLAQREPRRAGVCRARAPVARQRACLQRGRPRATIREAVAVMPRIASS